MDGGAAAAPEPVDPWSLVREHLRQSPEMFCFASLDGFLTEVNAAWTSALGWSARELCAAPYINLVHPDDLADTLREAERLQAGQAVVCFTNRYRARDGSYRWLEWNSSLDPRQGLVFAAVRDVTESRRQNRLAAEVEKITGVGSWEVELDSGRTFWSPMAYRIHDLDPLAFRPDMEASLGYYAPEALPTIRDAVGRLIGEAVAYDLELPLVTARGRRIWVRTTGAADQRDGKVLRVFGTVQDVSAERARREHLRTLSNVVETTTNVVILADGQGRAWWANAALGRLTGLGLDALAGRPDVDRLVKGDGAEQVAIETADGEICWLAVERQILGETRIVVGADITALKRQQARLRAAERVASAAKDDLANAIAVLDHGFALFDAEDRLSLCNERYREIYAASAPAILPGARFEDILRHGLANGQYPEAVGREESWLRERFAEHQTPGRNLIHQLPDDGWAQVREQRTPEGGRVGLSNDITETVRNQRRMENILHGADADAWEWDLVEGMVTVKARQSGDAPGRVAAEMIAAPVWRALIHPDDAAAADAALAAHLDGAAPFYDVEMRVGDGADGWTWVHEKGRAWGRGPTRAARWLSGVRRDISRRKATELALAEALRAAEAAAEAKSRFLANMSHEIRTPLTTVIGYVRLLAAEPDLSEAVRDHLRRANAGCDALLATVNDVLDYSKVEAGEIRIAPRGTDVAAVLRDTMELFAPRAAEKGLALRTGGLEGLPPGLLLDPDRLKQIVLNLMGNAVKFTASGEVALRADFVAEAGALRIEVVDSGPGVDATAKARLFRRFSQIDETNTRRHGGTGLGLAICKGLVEAMGGRIGCDSTPGYGSRFHFEIPAVEIEPAAPLPPQEVAALDGLRVLVAEDNEVSRAFIERVLRNAGAAPRCVVDGEAALRIAAVEPFDVILLDHRMPGLDGTDAGALVRDRPGPNQCAVLILVSADVDAVKRAPRIDFDAAVAKPLDAAALTTTIARALA